MTTFNTFPIDLTVAKTKMRVGIPASKYLAVDNASTGEATAYFDTVSAGAVSLTPGWTGTPNFKELFLDFSAQPGKKLLLIYGDDPTILDAGKTQRIEPNINQLVFSANSATNGPTAVIVTVAQNINGVKILGGIISALSGVVAPVGNRYITYLYTFNPNILRLASAVAVGVAPSFDVQTSKIEQFIIPPGYDINWVYSAPDVNGEATIVLNYQIL